MVDDEQFEFEFVRAGTGFHFDFDCATEMADGAVEDEKHKTKTLYIWGLDRSLMQDTVKEEFEKFAKVTRVTIIKDKATGASKGFGYVECETPEEATKAMKEADGKVIGENPVRIKYSYSETPEWLKYLDSKGNLGDRPSRGRGRGGMGRGRGRGGLGDRGRGEFREGYGRYDADGDGGRGLPPRRDDYYGRPPSYDDPYGRRPREETLYGVRRPIDDRIPYDDRRRPEAERMPLRRMEDPYERRPAREGIYDPPSGIYDDERPPRRPATNSYGSSRDEIYSSVIGRREINEDRRDLYRPSDREGYPVQRLDPLRTRSPPDAPRLPPATYRARSPADRPGVGERDPYDRRPPVRERDPYYDTSFRGAETAATVVSDYRPSYEVVVRPLSSYPERGPPPIRGPPERNPDMYGDPYERVDA